MGRAKRKEPEPVASFSLSIRDYANGRKGKRRDIVNINVWRTLQDMRRWGKEYRFVGSLGHAHAFCHSYDRFKPNGRRAPDFVEVNFCVKKLGSGVIAHEMFHAALAWARLHRIDGQTLLYGGKDGGDASNEEEAVAEVQGELVREVVSQCYELGLIK
ncbi:MAG: hypothetical protein MOB07_31600 [Acidobacteria bacterium]|nr:hypothetical protein [Acidobacteriota bacterium]